MKSVKRVFCCVLCSLLLAVGLAGCASFPGSGKQTTTFLDVFDTVCSVTAYGVEEEAFIRQVEELHRELQRYHCLFDIYHTYEGINNLKTINDAAGGQPVSVEHAPTLEVSAFATLCFLTVPIWYSSNLL